MAEPPDSAWATPRWYSAEYPKHLPIPNVDWTRVVKESKEKDGDSFYGPHPSVTQANVHELEMSVVLDSINPNVEFNQELPRHPGHIRRFWGDAGTVIGCADGKETPLFLVKYNMSGEVHGYPITPKKLNQLLRGSK